MTNAAVILSGSGVYDGSEIHEAVSLLLNLARNNARYQCFAPDKPQMHVVDHRTGNEASSEPRNALTEAARIARGDIKPLSDLNPDHFDALAAPGGFGAAKNLCTFATEGPDCTVDPEVERVFRAFHEQRKPIAVCCIAPVIPAKLFGKDAGGNGCEVTIGNDPDTAAAIHAMGSTNIEKPVNEAHTDTANLIVSAPAYMYGDAPIHQVEQGIAAMVTETLRLAEPAPQKA